MIVLQMNLPVSVIEDERMRSLKLTFSKSKYTDSSCSNLLYSFSIFQNCKHMCVSLSSDHSFSHWHEIQRIIDAHSLRQTEMFVARQMLYIIS